MKTPVFWNTRNLISTALLPASLLYRAATCLRASLIKPTKVNVPVLCIGGLTAGGAGKTPVCLHIGQLCRDSGIDAWFVSRGYKGKLTGPAQVKPSEHTAYDVGDEPLMLAQLLPTVIAKSRLAGAQFAAKAGAKLIIMDDGFQNPSIHKDTSIIVMDGKLLFGNERVIPAGPLREPVEHGSKRAQAVIIINPQQNMPHLQLPTLRARTVPNTEAYALRDKKVIAFCGLAYPQKFFATLRNIGAHIMEEKIFPDHYQFNNTEIEALALKARDMDAILVTTSKDAARMNTRSFSMVTVVHVTLEFEQPDALMALIRQTLANA